MSGRTKPLIAAALTLPLVAFVVGVLAAPDQPAPDRSRPVIIGHVDDGGDDNTGDRPGPPGRDRRDPPTQRPGDDSDDRDDRDADDRGDRDTDDDGPEQPGPGAVVTPAPRDLDDDDGGVGDDDDDGDDSDDGGSDD